jgi:acetylornithine deacetylase/succinyl-diaminopimelate desuccinylase-like protein
MSKMSKRLMSFLIILLSMGTSQFAQSASDYNQLARDIFRELIEIKSTESGVGSTPAAEAVSRRLLAAGFSAADVQVIGPEERKKNVVARLHGKGKGKPILLLSHLDVVEARVEDWSPGIDPFKFTERDGYFYGRGTQDIKDGAAILITNFIRWKQEGWVPDRDLILALTADEENGLANGVEWLVQKHRDLIDAEYCVNTDAGDFQSKDGKPEVVAISAAEKKFGMIQLQTTNRGGHGSLPRKDNAIYQLAAALQRVAGLQLPLMLNEVTRAQFAATSKTLSGRLAEDIRAVVQPTPDPAAVERLSQDPYYNALLRTTCVATMLEGGHAQNALPQRAKAELNCRIVPGHDPADILQKIKQAVNDPGVEVTWSFLRPETAPPSALRPDVVSSVESVSKKFWPGIAIIPTMETGATDGRLLRGSGIPTYGVSGVFIDLGDVRSHGRDERIRTKDFFAGVEFYDKFVKTLAKSPQP